MSPLPAADLAIACTAAVTALGMIVAGLIASKAINKSDAHTLDATLRALKDLITALRRRAP
ncbi:hypothetical protein ACEZCY_29570 [Streptacidiphilus sp. N1-12]|uniref:Uncharacterized protein n=2 Tax=Streptacidiphilus alkalitolerans TaxID=3342712 RepID=A0ABV6WMV7_9ACTN